MPYKPLAYAAIILGTVAQAEVDARDWGGGASPRLAKFYNCYDCDCNEFRTLSFDNGDNNQWRNFKQGAASVKISRTNRDTKGDCWVWNMEHDKDQFVQVKSKSESCINTNIGWIWAASCAWF